MKRKSSSKTVPVMESAPDSGFLADFLKRHYDLGKKVRCGLWDNNVNLTYYVRAGKKRYVLRIYRPGLHTKAEVHFELEQLLFLHAQGIPVAHPLRSKSGQLMAELRLPDGRSWAVVSHFASGGYRTRPVVTVGREIGTLLARMHLAQDRFPLKAPYPALDASGLVSAPLALLRPYRASFGKEWKWLLRTAARLKRELQKLPRRKPLYGLIHGDTHNGNMHYDKATRTHRLFDFDLTVSGWRIFDLATYFWAVNWKKGPEFKRGAKALLKAYSKLRPLEPIELKSLPAMLAARHLWWMGFQARLAERLSTKMVSERSHYDKLKYLRAWANGKLAKGLPRMDR